MMMIMMLMMTIILLLLHVLLLLFTDAHCYKHDIYTSHSYSLSLSLPVKQNYNETTVFTRDGRSARMTGPFCRWVAREPAICARHRPVLSVGGARTSDLCASQARSVGGWRENQRSVLVTGPFCRWVAREPAICARHRSVLSVGGARTSDLCSSQARSVGGWRENQRYVRMTGPFCRWVAREPAICAHDRPVLSVGGARTSDLCSSQARSVGGWRENQRSVRMTGPFCRWVAREPAICARHRPVLSVGGARTSDLCA